MATRLLVVSDQMGRGSEELGQILMKNFLYSAARGESTPTAITFMNGGVRLTCAGSSSLADIQLLSERGVAIFSCGTCLDYLGLKDSLQVGEIGTMVDSAEALLGGDTVVTIG